MDDRSNGTMLQHLRQLFELQAAWHLGDTELLRRFALQRDEAAFAALVHCYGGLVWKVCRRQLRQEQDVEDAFQATFLVLARKAGSIRKEQSVGSWLYGTAFRVAGKARVAAARRSPPTRGGGGVSFAEQ